MKTQDCYTVENGDLKKHIGVIIITPTEFEKTLAEAVNLVRTAKPPELPSVEYQEWLTREAK